MNIALHDPNGNMGVPPALKVKEKGKRQSRKTERGQKEDGRERERSAWRRNRPRGAEAFYAARQKRFTQRPLGNT